MPSLFISQSDSLDSKNQPIFYLNDLEQGRESIPGVYYINGTFWDKFSKKQKLGEGTSGVVRKCKRRADRKNFAVKIIKTRDDEITQQVHQSILNT